MSFLIHLNLLQKYSNFDIQEKLHQNIFDNILKHITQIQYTFVKIDFQDKAYSVFLYFGL